MKILKSLKRLMRDMFTLDLFADQKLTCKSHAPEIRTERVRRSSGEISVAANDLLPTIDELQHRYDRYNAFYFDGKLPPVRIEYSARMLNAGSYTPSLKLIRIGRKYHELYPEDIDDTLRHEMIHVRNPSHNAAFKREAERVGASLKGKAHPSLVRPPRYLYECPGCHTRFPRHKQFRLASCGTCSPNGRYDERFKLRRIKPEIPSSS